jgi:hypothetical protein
MRVRNSAKQSVGRLSFLFVCLSIAVGLSAAEREMTASSTAVDDILVHARKSVESFWGQFKSVTCVEKVTQEKLGKQGGVEYARKSTFDYLVLLNMDKDALSVDESRLEQGKKSKEKNIPLLITSGIPTLLLVFHPLYREGFHYRLEGEEISGGRRLARIHFEHIPGTRSTTALRLRGKNYPLDIQGTAWIDPVTGAIHRIAAGIGAPLSDLNLKALEMEVRYDPHEFSTREDIYWLPSTATISIKTERQHWRNMHRYSGYKRFTVATEDVVLR